MAEDEDNASKTINAAAREMIRVVRHPATDEYLIVLDTSVVPDNAVLVYMSAWGTPLEKGAKTSDVDGDNIFVCKPVKSKTQTGKVPAQPTYRLVKRHTGKFQPVDGPSEGSARGTAAAAAAGTKRAKPEKAAGEKKKKTAVPKKPKNEMRQDPNTKMLQDMIKVIQKHAKK